MINYHRLVMNLRGAGALSARQIECKTGVKQAKLYRIASKGVYVVHDVEMVSLLDLHYDNCPHLHNKRQLLIFKRL